MAVTMTNEVVMLVVLMRTVVHTTIWGATLVAKTKTVGATMRVAAIKVKPVKSSKSQYN